MGRGVPAVERDRGRDAGLLSSARRPDRVGIAEGVEGVAVDPPGGRPAALGRSRVRGRPRGAGW